MSQRGRLLLVFVVGLAVGLLVFMPARLLGAVLAAGSAGRLQLDQPEGSLWRGQGSLNLRTDGGRVPLGWIGWRASAPGLLLGRLDIAGEQQLAGRVGQFVLRLSLGEASFSRLDITLPGGVLVGLSPVLAALQPAGTLRLQSDGFLLAHGRGLAGFSGQFQIDWQPASFLGGVHAGDYRASLQGSAGSPVQGRLLTLGGGLNVDGELTLAERSGVQLKARVRLMPEADKARLMPVFRALCASGQEECYLPASGRR